MVYEYEHLPSIDLPAFFDFFKTTTKFVKSDQEVFLGTPVCQPMCQCLNSMNYHAWKLFKIIKNEFYHSWISYSPIYGLDLTIVL